MRFKFMFSRSTWPISCSSKSVLTNIWL